MQVILQENEKILLEFKPKPSMAWYLLLSRAWHVLLLLVVLAVMTSFSPPGSVDAAGNVSFEPLLHHYGMVILVLLVIIGYFWFRQVIRSYDYVITNQRAILRYGFLSLNKRIIPYSQVNDVNLSASFFERMFGLGSVYIDCLGTVFSAVGFNRNRAANNTTRLEGLALEECEQVLQAISKELSNRR